MAFPVRTPSSRGSCSASSPCARRTGGRSSAPPTSTPSPWEREQRRDAKKIQSRHSPCARGPRFRATIGRKGPCLAAFERVTRPKPRCFEREETRLKIMHSRHVRILKLGIAPLLGGLVLSSSACGGEDNPYKPQPAWSGKPASVPTPPSLPS